MIFSLMFIFMNHPLSMGLLLMLQTIIISIFTGTLTKTFWFSYSLFLIFLGGMLILFMYMTSIASNETFKFSINKKPILFFFLTTILFMLLFFFMNYKNILMNKIFNMENQSMQNFNNLIMENNLTLNKLYNFPTNIITILLINYLFLTLIVTVKITNIFEGPLRAKT
uniref:NADH dehydrogenase subunit 6 n=1 Tax=Microtendipes umbrosus TaxID=2562924 RepID=UPI0021CC6E10|nr:NADH dehydrogenase subunit 6 [Microtendipes umbrosus]UWR98454.1 NADH dehydrogenase subunit 6 [Microtendipes umbrosus]